MKRKVKAEEEEEGNKKQAWQPYRVGVGRWGVPNELITWAHYQFHLIINYLNGEPVTQ